jgi:hypothetical protein
MHQHTASSSDATKEAIDLAVRYPEIFVTILE